MKSCSAITKLQVVIVVLVIIIGIGAAGYFATVPPTTTTTATTTPPPETTTTTVTTTTTTTTLPQPAIAKEVKVYFWDVGQGDSILVVTSEKTVLIDGGPRGAGDVVVRRLWSLRIAVIDIAVATHNHADHIGGLISVMAANFTIRSVLDNGQTSDTKTYADYIALASKIGVTIAKRGDVYPLGQDAKMIVLNPQQPLEFEEPNYNSVVLRLEAFEQAVMLMGDCEERCERSILRAGLNVQGNVLKVGHHGSRTSTSAAFLDTVSPSIAVISAGAGNQYGHPHPETLQKLQDRQVQVWRTDQNGNIAIVLAPAAAPSISTFLALVVITKDTTFLQVML